MGVKGLTPFLQKVCPDVLKKLPNRLQSLRGKRIVLDGTLITQRLHFTRRDHPYRHILGWYRVAQELNENGVSAICVFDGKERSVAKTREVQRRTAVRHLTESRGSIERERFQRLRQLKEGVELYQKLSVIDKQQFVKALENLPITEDGASTLLQYDPLRKQKGETTSSTGEASSIFPPQDQMPLTGDIDLAMSPDKLASHFKSLNVNYKVSVAKLVSVDSVAVPSEPEPAPALMAKVVAEDTQPSQTVTKLQHDLTVQEGKLWKETAKSLESLIPAFSENVGQELDILLQKSYVMSTSFDRRINKPSVTTYNESKDILRAMGIPCIDAIGAVEAEALASSIVLQGHADYVASEDTDVLVYEVPLMKNITNPSEPLVIVSGAEIRASLGLNREAYVDLALLMGTDFTDRIKNLGPMRAYQFIKEYGNIERIVEFIQSDPRYVSGLPWETYLSSVNTARLVFKTLPPVPPPESLQAIEKIDQNITDVLGRYGLSFAQMAEDNWDYDAAHQITLGGNHFGDAPTAS